MIRDPLPTYALTVETESAQTVRLLLRDAESGQHLGRSTVQLSLDWDVLKQLLRGNTRAAIPRGPSDAPHALGNTGAALELLRVGVPQVVAVRYAVGDAYARELARWFYRRLLAGTTTRETDDALALARVDVAKEGRPKPMRMSSTGSMPFRFGQPGLPFTTTDGRSGRWSGCDHGRSRSCGTTATHWNAPCSSWVATRH